MTSATVRERQAGNAVLVGLPLVLAPSAAAAADVGLVVARDGGGWEDELLAVSPPA